MKPNKYEKKFKDFLKLRRELDEIRDKLKNLPLIPFEKPIQKGWYIKFEMRKDISNRQDSHWIQKAMDIGYKPQYINNVKHVRMMRAGLKGYWTNARNGRRVWMTFEPYKLYFKESQFDKFPVEIKKYFKMDRYHINPYNRNKYRIVLPSYWLIPKARPNFHTHYQKKGGFLESKQAFIEYKLSEYWRLYGTNYSKSYPARKDRTKTRIQIQKFKKGEIPDILYEKVPLEYCY